MRKRDHVKERERARENKWSQEASVTHRHAITASHSLLLTLTSCSEAENSRQLHALHTSRWRRRATGWRYRQCHCHWQLRRVLPCDGVRLCPPNKRVAPLLSIVIVCVVEQASMSSLLDHLIHLEPFLLLLLHTLADLPHVLLPLMCMLSSFPCIERKQSAAFLV